MGQLSGRRKILTGLISNTGQHSPKESTHDDEMDLGISQHMLSRRSIQEVHKSPDKMHQRARNMEQE